MRFNSRRHIICLALLFLPLTWVSAGITSTALAQGPESSKTSAKPASQPEVTPLTLYQNIISRADGQRCPMYPSDSHYARQAFKRYGVIVGWVLALDRLLRCGHDETRRAPHVRIKGNVLTYDPLQANTFWWDKR